LAVGALTPIYHVFYRLFPFFRYPSKLFFLAGFSLLVLSALGLERLFSALHERKKTVNILFFTLCFILIADLYTTHRYLNPLTDATIYQYHHPCLNPITTDPGTFRVHLQPALTGPSNVQKTIFNQHVLFQMFLAPNLGILHNLSHVSGTSPLELRYQYVISEILNIKSWKKKIRFLRLANVKYIIASERLDKISELEGQVEKVNTFVYRIKGYLPRAWVVGKLLPVGKGTREDLTSGFFDPFTSALAKGKIIEKYDTPFFKKITSITYKNDRIQIELTLDTPGILVLSESSYPGWRVFVDGQENTCLWLNLLFQGVEVDKGHHKIDFVYRPKHFALASAISLTALILFLCSWLYCQLYPRSRRTDKLEE